MGRYADLAGKTAIVTGGSAGIGAAIARLFGQNGVNVVVVGSKQRALAEQVAEELVGYGTRSFALLADVTRESEVQRMLDETLERLGQIDILVNNAGGTFGVTSTRAMTLDDWNSVMALNLTSCFLCSHHVLPHMQARKWGRIINVSSVSAIYPNPAKNPAYAAAKAGMLGFTRHLAIEVIKDGITVNATAPGTTLTPRAEQNLRNPEVLAARMAAVPMGRFATSEEQAGIIVFLASEEASYITGATFDVSGGRAF